VVLSCLSLVTSMPRLKLRLSVAHPLSGPRFVLRGAFFALKGVFGVLRADAVAEAAALRGVCGSRAVVGSGSALLR
jgi:hypothetical protein